MSDNNKHSRFKDLMWYDPGFAEIIVGGTGGIGSWLSLLLARMGYTLHLFDDDVIDESNMAGQLYKLSDVGKNKADAMVKIIRDFSGNLDATANGRYTEESGTSDVVFSCFDNMSARKLMFEQWAADEDRKIFIDGRMNAETFQIFCVIKGREDAYREKLFDDSEVPDQPCSAKATSHTAAMLSGMMAAAFTNFVSNEKEGDEIKEVPFETNWTTALFMHNSD